MFLLQRDSKRAIKTILLKKIQKKKMSKNLIKLNQWLTQMTLQVKPVFLQKLAKMNPERLRKVQQNVVSEKWLKKKTILSTWQSRVIVRKSKQTRSLLQLSRLVKEQKLTKIKAAFWVMIQNSPNLCLKLSKKSKLKSSKKMFLFLNKFRLTKNNTQTLQSLNRRAMMSKTATMGLLEKLKVTMNKMGQSPMKWALMSLSMKT